MINIEQSLQEKSPKLASEKSVLSKPMIKALKALMHEDEINEFIETHKHLKGFEFLDQILEQFDFSYSVSNKQRANIPTEGRAVIIANHPIGSLDGLALLHEIGNSISYRKIQMHGAYLLEYSELAGFSQTEQKTLSTLVLAHRRKVPTRAFDGFIPEKFRKTLICLAILLRLSALLQRDRDDHPTPDITVSDNAIRIKFNAAWMEQHSLTQVDLEHEIQYLKKCDIELSYEA